MINKKKCELVMEMGISAKPNKNLIFMLCAAMLLLCAPAAQAAIENASLTVISEQDYSDIFLGISTGGYDLLAERGSSFAFEVFVKNGMPDRALHNIAISPANFPFGINSITPKMIGEVKPMEIVMFIVNTTIPADAQVGKYSVSFDVSSTEFPTGVFWLSTEIKVLNRINTGLYAFYAAVTIALLALLFYRKRKIALQAVDTSKKKEHAKHKKDK
jgi:hypothetical protein